MHSRSTGIGVGNKRQMGRVLPKGAKGIEALIPKGQMTDESQRQRENFEETVLPTTLIGRERMEQRGVTSENKLIRKMFAFCFVPCFCMLHSALCLTRTLKLEFKIASESGNAVYYQVHSVFRYFDLSDQSRSVKRKSHSSHKNIMIKRWSKFFLLCRKNGGRNSFYCVGNVFQL